MVRKQSRLESIGDLTIDHTNLSSLEGLNSLEYIGEYFLIWDNWALCTSEAEALRDQVLAEGGIGGFIYISGNKDCQYALMGEDEVN